MTTPVYRGTPLPLIVGRPVLELAGRAGYTLALEPGREDHQFSWSPEARDVNNAAPAGDLDLQMMWLSAERPNNNPPLVWWRIEYGHGGVVYSVPQLSPLGTPGTFQTTHGWMLPQRGLRLRLPSRALKLFFFTPAETPPPPEPVEPGGAPCTIQVSVQPCHGMEPQLLPLTDAGFGQAFPGGTTSQFPLGATEMRFCDPNTGLPFAGVQEVVFLDITGVQAGAAVPLALLADWRPIPLFAAFWISTTDAAQVSYR